MKKLDYSLSRLISGFAVLFLIFSIANSCTKSDYEDHFPPDPPSGPSGYKVSIGGGFNPVEIKISAGDMVTWINNSSEIESVTSNDGFYNAIIGKGQTYSFKFLSVGTFTYYSRIHPNMVGKVVVN